MLVAQSQAENMPIITNEAIFREFRCEATMVTKMHGGPARLGPDLFKVARPRRRFQNSDARHHGAIVHNCMLKETFRIGARELGRWCIGVRALSVGSCFIDRPYCAASPRASHRACPAPALATNELYTKNLRVISTFSRTEP